MTAAEAALLALLGTDHVHRCLAPQAKAHRTLSLCRGFWRGEGRLDEDRGGPGDPPRLRHILESLGVPPPAVVTYLSAEEWRLQRRGGAAPEEGEDSTTHIMLSLCRGSLTVPPLGGLIGAASASMQATVHLEGTANVREGMATVVAWGHRLKSFPGVMLIEAEEGDDRPSLGSLPEQLHSIVLLRQGGHIIEDDDDCENHTYVLCVLVAHLEGVGWCAAQRRRLARGGPWCVLTDAPCLGGISPTSPPQGRLWQCVSLPASASVAVAAYARQPPPPEPRRRWRRRFASGISLAVALVAGPGLGILLLLLLLLLGLPHRQSPPPPPSSGAPRCAVCLDRPVEHLLLPCRHACLCAGCRTVAACPLCRRGVDSIERIYL